MPLERLTRQRIIEALNLLGQMAEREMVELELCIYGGSAMMLGHLVFAVALWRMRPVPAPALLRQGAMA